jgi:hypothetical protein
MPWGETNPGRHLASIFEVMSAADAGPHRAGGVGADLWQGHQAFAAGIVLRRFGNDPVVVRDGPFRLIFFSREEPRMHGHIAHPDGEATSAVFLPGRKTSVAIGG